MTKAYSLNVLAACALTFSALLATPVTGVADDSALVQVSQERVPLDTLTQIARDLPSIAQKFQTKSPTVTHTGSLAVVLIDDNRWTLEVARRRVLRTSAVFLQCGVLFDDIAFYRLIPQKIGVRETLKGPWISASLNRPEESLKPAHYYGFVTRIGDALRPYNLNRPTIVYTEDDDEQFPNSAEAFPAYRATFPHPSFRNDVSYVPYHYERDREVTESYKTPDFLVEAHELGHVLHLIRHDWKSPLMSGGAGMINPWVTWPQSNEIAEEDCAVIHSSPHLHNVRAR